MVLVKDKLRIKGETVKRQVLMKITAAIIDTEMNISLKMR